MTVDDRLAFLGEWGCFQQQVFFLLCLSAVPNGLISTAIVFLGDTPPHWCLIPTHANLTAAWRNFSIPVDESMTGGKQVRAQCTRYRLADIQAFSERDLLPGVDVNLSTVSQEDCMDGWEYDRSLYASTIVTEWDLVCDNQWKNPLTSSVFFCGVLAGSAVTGQFSDRYGRKIMLLLSLAIQTGVQIIQAFSQSWVMFCILFFFVGFGHISNYLIAFVLGFELLGPRMRNIFCTAGICLFFSLGYMLLPLLAFLFRSWNGLLLALSVPNFLLVPLYWYVPESPRWLLSQGRVEEAEVIVKAAAKRNKVMPSERIFRHLQTDCQLKERKAHICDLLRSRNIRWISITLWFVWNSLTLGYYVLSLNTSNIHGSPYLNCFLSAVVELPAYILSWLLFHWCERRLTLSSILIIGGLCLFAIPLMPANLISFAFVMEIMGKFGITTAFAITYAYCGELYPTVLRNTAVGTCSTIARIGSIIAPYVLELRSYSTSLSYTLVGSTTVLSGLLSLLLPESYGIPLPDTITHMQQFPGCCKKTKYALTHTAEEENNSDPESPRKENSGNAIDVPVAVH